MARYVNAILATLVAVAVAATAFMAGAMFGANERVPIPRVTQGPDPSSVQLVREVRDIIKREALKPSSEESMTSRALEGMLESLEDTYATYLDARHYGYFEDDNAGDLQGIGVTIMKKDKKVVIESVMKDTPALKAGLKAGDEIVTIDGTTKPEWQLDDVVKRIRGKAGTKVTVEVVRAGKSLEYTVTRARIHLPNIESEMVDGKVGYIRLSQFTDKAGTEVETAIKDLDGKGAQSFVLDLRDNPGGLLEASVDVASLFVKSGVIVRIDSRADGESVRTTTMGRATEKPLVVLVNENSASASEIVAGALQDYRRAKIVGMRTFGKGSVQDVETLSNGGAVKLTVAHYLTPKKRAIDGKGLNPDVEVKMDPAKQEPRSGDVQFARAIELAKKAR